MAGTLDDQLDHFVRFRDHYPAERIHGILAQLSTQHPDDPAVHAALGRFCARLGLVGEAHRFHQSVIEKSDDPQAAADARLGRAALLRDEAATLLRQAEQFALQAFAARRQAVVAEPASIPALMRCAEALTALGHVEEAGRLLGRAERLEPRGAIAALGCVTLALRTGRLEEAAALLSAALEAAPRSPDLLKALIEVEDRRNRPEGVIDACMRLLKLLPYNPPVARRLSDAMGRQGWFEAALKEHQAALPPSLEASFLKRIEALPPRRGGGRRVRFISFGSRRHLRAGTEGHRCERTAAWSDRSPALVSG